MKVRGSVPNVVRARKEGAIGRAAVQSKVGVMRKGTEGSKLNDRVSGALRTPKRRNS